MCSVKYEKNSENLIAPRASFMDTQSVPSHRASCLVDHVLLSPFENTIIPEQGTPHFHSVPGSTYYVAGLCTIKDERKQGFLTWVECEWVFNKMEIKDFFLVLMI